jgi:hypothetical protein
MEINPFQIIETRRLKKVIRYYFFKTGRYFDYTKYIKELEDIIRIIRDKVD